jgi:hypothetical protein
MPVYRITYSGSVEIKSCDRESALIDADIPEDADVEVEEIHCEDD